MSETPKHILNKIREAKEKQLKELDLSSNYRTSDDRKLTQIPDEVFELEQLEVLKLSRNLLTSIPDSIARLQNLTLLNLNGNELTDITESIFQLQHLTWLDLSNNQLIFVPESISQLKRLTTLYLPNNQLTFLPESISQLQNLVSLNLYANQLITVPGTITELQNLAKFELGKNQFTAIPDAIYELSSLQELSFANFLVGDSHVINQIKEISPRILQLMNLRKLNLEGNPLEVPPPEVMARGVKAVKDYFRQLEREGQDYLYEAKLLIIGEGGAGKTTLARKIENPAYQLRDEDTTKGIEVVRWEFPLPADLPGLQDLGDLNKTFRVNIWDFGGQEIYHATHQFFLTKRSLYTLVADTRREDTDFYYWLNVVELLSDNSPLLIIKNEKQDRHREINERQLRGQFTNLEKTLATNLATSRGLPEILAEIKHQVCLLPHVGTALPKTWVKVREALESDPRHYISLEEYLAICQQHGFTQLKDKLQLSGYLHDLGVCLHFQDDPLLKKKVILKPEWGTAAVYKVLDNKTVINNLGRFSRADLEHIWHEEQYAGMQDELLQLMMKFKLCYQIPGSANTYIAPQLLTENQPAYPWPEANNLRLRYTYKFMPKGILTQFIVATHPLIAVQRYVWKSGVILKKDQAAAEVIEHYGKREITIRAVGKRKKELLTIVTYELDKIHDSYRRLKCDKLIPCNCPACKASSDPHFYRLEILRKFADDHQDLIQCQHSYQMVNVWGLIDEVIDRRVSLIGEEGFESSNRGYNLKRIRALLMKGFNEAELRQLCYDEPDFRPVYEELAEVTGKVDIAGRIVEFAERRELLDTLLIWARVKNPAKYEKLKPYYLE